MQMISQLLQQILFIYVKLCWERAGFDLRNSLMSLQNSNQNMVCSSDSDHGSSGCDSNYTTFEIHILVSENIDDGEANIFKLNCLKFSFQSDTNNKVIY